MSKNIGLIVAALGAFLLLSKNTMAAPFMGSALNVPGATPTPGGYYNSPAYGGQTGNIFPGLFGSGYANPAVLQQQQQQQQAQSWGNLGAALGNVFNKIAGSPSTPAASQSVSGSNGFPPMPDDTAGWSTSGSYAGGTVPDNTASGSAPDMGQYTPNSLSGLDNFYG